MNLDNKVVLTISACNSESTSITGQEKSKLTEETGTHGRACDLDRARLSDAADDDGNVAWDSTRAKRGPTALSLPPTRC